MENDEWRMDNGKRKCEKMENRQWTMENGKLKMETDKGKMKN